MKTDLQNILVRPQTSVLDAMKAIDVGTLQIALVVDSEKRLLATLTDGDIRRGLLRGVALDAPVSEIMSGNPKCVRQSDGPDAALRLMRKLTLHHIPVVDDQGRLVGLEWVDDLIGLQRLDTWIVLMAGGLGTRLKPHTDKIPKPMIDVGGRPMLESIIRNFASQGFHRFFLSVNHRREILQDHFGDGSELNVDIEYLIEDKPLGTAGALSLLPTKPDRPLLVMNCDVLTSVRFDKLLRFHDESGADATMCAREFSTQIPYGVVRIDNGRLVQFDEKPVQRHFVNAGIYVLSPSTLALISKNTRLDMPTLFQRLLETGRSPMVFPVSEYWMDIGHVANLTRAREDFDSVFGQDE